ncbi:hypothetical protein cypCar_00036015 [Cyprinus carpio]|nr:hypothetical protein cypCar_00036015 [Cyprinus carpio]
MFKLEEKLLIDVIREITQATEEAEQDSTINDIKGFIQVICRKLQERLFIPRDVVDKISTLNIANHKKKKNAQCLHCSVKDMDKSLKASFKKSSFESRIKHLQTKPQDVLFKRLQGCGKQCPFCQALCEAGGEAHSKHFVSIHRPEGLGRCRFHNSKQLVTDICTSSVNSNSCFKCHDTKDQWHPYKEYDTIYPDWRIDREPNIEPSAYWIYVMAQFNNRFAEEYDANPADIPLSLKGITKIRADKSLK